MAIAGIVLQTTDSEALSGRLRAIPHVVDIQPTEAAGTLAAVVEADASRMEAALAELAKLDGVLNLGLVSVSYEDELDEKGHISCPVHKPRTHAVPVQEDEQRSTS